MTRNSDTLVEHLDLVKREVGAFLKKEAPQNEHKKDLNNTVTLAQTIPLRYISFSQFCNAQTVSRALISNGDYIHIICNPLHPSHLIFSNDSTRHSKAIVSVSAGELAKKLHDAMVWWNDNLPTNGFIYVAIATWCDVVLMCCNDRRNNVNVVVSKPPSFSHLTCLKRYDGRTCFTLLRRDLGLKYKRRT